mmetsp:Transcript_6993/g.5243  ORF Transcript_6993/g.5243 Transcript_6993/m.5243 type:complete len:98 (+) Transcript_6993:525-818(+)
MKMMKNQKRTERSHLKKARVLKTLAPKTFLLEAIDQSLKARRLRNLQVQANKTHLKESCNPRLNLKKRAKVIKLKICYLIHKNSLLSKKFVKEKRTK